MEAEKSEVKLTVENRKTLLMDGVIHVIGFDEDYVSLDTKLGRVVIEGEEMKIESLSNDDGEIKIVGLISAVIYTDQKTKAGMLRRLFK